MRPRVAFQGERGAFSEDAARVLVGARAEVVPCQRFEDVFKTLRARKADLAVIPIENTLHGSVHENYDHLLAFRTPIIGEAKIRIVHNLIAAPGTRLAEVRKLYSHPVAINQCLRFFARNPRVEREPFYDTAGAVKMVMEKRPPGVAAIASSLAARTYGARILKRSIEDDRQNFTRFFLIHRPGGGLRPARRVPGATKAEWKTSIAFTLRNLPGALFRTLSVFALRDLNLTKIESRPLRGKPWEYLFYIDFVGKSDDLQPRRALDHLQEFTDVFQLLGSYPRGA